MEEGIDTKCSQEIQEIQESPLKELQSSLKELKEIYTSMQKRIKELEELADNEDIINSAMEWVFTHCQVDADGKFQIGNTQYTWISFLKDIITLKIDFTTLEKHIVPKQEYDISKT